jgi:hypothetical protein
MSSVLRDPAIQISHPQKESCRVAALRESKRPAVAATALSGGWGLEIDQRAQPTLMTR